MRRGWFVPPRQDPGAQRGQASGDRGHPADEVRVPPEVGVAVQPHRRAIEAEQLVVEVHEDRPGGVVGGGHL